MAKVIRVKEKSNINNLIIVDCLANILTVLLHMAIHTPLFKLRLAQCFIFISSVAGRSDRSSRSYDATLRVAHHCTGGPPKTKCLDFYSEQNRTWTMQIKAARQGMNASVKRTMQLKFSVYLAEQSFSGAAALHCTNCNTCRSTPTSLGRANAFFHIFSWPHSIGITIHAISNPSLYGH